MCLVVFRQFLRSQHLEFQYFACHLQYLQYLQQTSDGSFSETAVFTGPHRGPRPLPSFFCSTHSRFLASRSLNHLMSAAAQAAQGEAQTAQVSERLSVRQQSHKRLVSSCSADYSMYSTFLVSASPGSVLFSRSYLLKRKDLCFSCLRLGLIRHCSLED
jgi:hypothetical protein